MEGIEMIMNIQGSFRYCILIVYLDPCKKQTNKIKYWKFIEQVFWKCLVFLKDILDLALLPDFLK